MLAFLSNLTPGSFGEIIGGILSGLGFGVGGYAIGKSRSPIAVQQLKDYATKEELKELEKKHDSFENRIRAQIREGEQRTHQRLDILASKMDESIGIQKADSRILQSLLQHLITPTSHDQK